MKNTATHRTGLFFGSFNPVHIGHLIIAEYMVQHTDIREVWFILSPRNPLKEPDEVPEGNERMKMLHAAVSGNPSFTASDIELSMPVPSYTINTIRKLKSDHPSRQFVLMIGMDNLRDFHRWKDHRDILDALPCYVYPRGVAGETEFDQHPGVRIIDAPNLDISSSMIRRSIARGNIPRYMLPEEVWQHLRVNDLYRKQG